MNIELALTFAVVFGFGFCLGLGAAVRTVVDEKQEPREPDPLGAFIYRLCKSAGFRRRVTGDMGNVDFVSRGRLELEGEVYAVRITALGETSDQPTENEAQS